MSDSAVDNRAPAGERITRLEIMAGQFQTFMETHDPEAMAQYRDLWGAIDGVRGSVDALRSDIMLAKGATRAAGIIATIMIVIVGAVWTLIQAVISHVPLK